MSWAPQFLEALSNTGNVRYACKSAGVARQTAYDFKGKDAEFAEKWDDAIDESTDVLELECRRRALHGVERKRWVRSGTDAKGKPQFEQVVEREYSDVLLMFLLKANAPQRFREGFDLKTAVAIAASIQESADGGHARTPKAPVRKRPA